MADRKLKEMLERQISVGNFKLVNAFKRARVESHLKFLRECRRTNLIPFGFRVKDRFSNTFTEIGQCSKVLAERQSRQWLQLAIECLYKKKDHLRSTVQPLSTSEFKTLCTYEYYLRLVKRQKRANLHSENIARNDVTRRDLPTITGFSNISNIEFNDTEKALLAKGPSYVPPMNCGWKEKVTFAAEVQACHDRVLKTNPTVAQSAAFNEFLSGVQRISSEVKRKDHESQKINDNIYSIKFKLASNNSYIYPSDKTNRLIALSDEIYDGILKNCLNEADVEIRPTLPATRQKQINEKLTAVANNYQGTDIAASILRCKVSDPLPSKPYCLPKDHKEGPLKGRPIISTINSSIRRLSKFIAKILHPLICSYVSAHLESTKQFTDSIKEIQLTNTMKFGSLDVRNLYGSIPIEDQDQSLGLITIVTKFYEQHHEQSIVPNLCPADFKKLLTMALHDDVYLIDGKFKQQNFGIAMGNCAAPPLAVIYMHHIEQQILQQHPQISFWKRYIDDVFYISTLSPSQMLSTANSINQCIQFTIEEPVNNTISFLDTKVTAKNNCFQYQLFIKPTHSNAIMPASSYVPTSRKANLVKSETRRAIKNGSDSNNGKLGVNIIKQRLAANGYSKEFIRKNTYRSESTTEKTEPISYIKVPYQDEKQRWKINTLLQRTGLKEQIRVIYKTEQPLSRQFRKPLEQQKCPQNCLSCRTAKKPDKCFVKNSIYKISVYIGQTGRTIRSRIQEHMRQSSSHVYQHMVSHGRDNNDNFTWSVISVVADLNTRLAAEGAFIQKSRDTLMNGCEGLRLLPFL